MKEKLEIKENICLAPLTTMGIGGRARYFVRTVNETQVAEAVDIARRNDLKLFVLGGGSNLLISDAGFDGLVLQIALTGITGGNASVNERADGTEEATLLNSRVSARFITAQAGHDWDEVVAYCVKSDLAGVECLSGIPGFVGGTPIQNVGAYGQEVSETIVSVRCFDRQTLDFIELGNAECGFAYRTSIFNSTHQNRFIVLAVKYALQQGGGAKVVYRDLLEHFDCKTPSLREVRDAVLRIRRSKSMVIDPADPNSKSAGSFFKNPLVDKQKLDNLQNLFENVPFFEFGDKFKIPAAWLIENAGFNKGYALGEAGISANHTLALINRGKASATEIISLKNKIQKTVIAKFGIELHPEPIFIGF